MTETVETPSFTFRVERVPSLQGCAEEHAREELRTASPTPAALAATGLSSSPSVNGIL